MAQPFAFTFQSSNLGFPNPLILQEAYQQWYPDPSIFRGIELMPEEPYYDSEIIAYDVMGTMSGATHATTLGASPKYITMPKRYTMYLPTQYWSEALRFDESDFVRVRRAGSINQLAGEQLIMLGMKLLDLRLATRLEINRWAALFGILTINADGINRLVNYGIPAANQVVIGSTAGYGDPWNLASSATIIEDLQRVTEILFGKAEGLPDLWINGYDVKYLAQNVELRDLLKQSVYSITLGRDTIQEVFPKLVGSIGRIIVYNAGYIDETSGLFTPFIPLGHALMVGNPVMGQKFAAYRTTPSVHNSGPTNPQPGKYVVIEDHTNKIDAEYLMATGFNGVPCIFLPECLVTIQMY